MGFNKKFYQTGGLVASTPPSGGGGLDPLQNFETVTYTGNGSTQKITGYIRKGAAFNGSSSSILLSNTIFNLNNIFSFSAWVNTTKTNYAFIVSSRYADNTFSLQMQPNGTVTAGDWQTSANNITTTTTINDGNWHHIVYVNNNGSITIYIDGISSATGTHSLVTQTVSNGNQIGNWDANNAESWQGKIDQVRIFNTALNSTQVGELALETYADPKKSTTDYFGNGSGVALYELDENANDTGDTYNGIPTNVNFLGMAFQPDLVWIKGRTFNDNHLLFDSIRGVQNNLYPNLTVSNISDSNSLLSFDDNGFTIGLSSTINPNSENLVAWCWRAAGAANTYNVLEGGTVTSDSTASGAGITAGTITNNWEVSANRDAGFSIVKYTGNSSFGQSVGHGLSQPPEMIFFKNLSIDRDWRVYNHIIGATKYLQLDSVLGAGTFGSFNNTDPTSEVFYTTNSASADTATNNSGNNYIAYCFHSVDGYQRVGSYEGSTSNVTVHTDSNGDGTGTGAFQPRFVLVKNVDTAGNWTLWDNIRGGSVFLQPNNSGTEASFRTLTFNSDGFTINTDAGANGNSNGDTYIFLAIA